MLILSRRIDQRIVIDDRIEITVVDIKGEQVRIGIKAPQDVKVFRYEVFQAIQDENRAAASSQVELPTLSWPRIGENDSKGEAP